jgi:hypothetical protein
MVKCLSLTDDVAYRLSSFLKNNQKADTYFSIKDEKRIWDKLKPDLRQGISALIQKLCSRPTFELSKNACSS